MDKEIKNNIQTEDIMTFDDMNFEETSDNDTSVREENIDTGPIAASYNNPDVLYADALTSHQIDIIQSHLDGTIGRYVQIVRESSEGVQQEFWNKIAAEVQEEGGFTNDVLTQTIKCLRKNVEEANIARQELAQKILNRDLAQGLAEGFTKKSRKKDVAQKTKKEVPKKQENVVNMGEIKKEVSDVLSDDIKKKYLSQFNDLSKKEIAKKEKFFDRSVQTITNKIVKSCDNGKNNINVNEYVRNLLAKGGIYSKINKVFKNEQKNVNVKEKNMKFEAPQNKSEKKEKKLQSAEDLVQSASVDEISDILKQSSEKNINSNLAEVGAELDDLNKRIADMESTLKSPIKDMNDKGATTQADIDKLIKRGEVVFSQQKKLEKQKALMKQKEVITEYVEQNSKIDVEGKEKELEEMRVEIKKMDKQIASGKNYESKSEFGADDLDVNKGSVLVKKRDALNEDIKQLDGIVANGKKVEAILKKIGAKTENPVNRSEDKKQADKKEIPKATTQDEKSRDTDMNEEEKFDKEVARRDENKTLGSQEDVKNMDVIVEGEEVIEINPDDLEDMDAMNPDGAIEMERGTDGQWRMEGDEGSSMEELREILDNTRSALVSKSRKSETAMNKIRSLLGANINADNISDEIKQLQANYDEALENVRSKINEQKDGMREVEQKKINEDLRFMDFDEGVAMNEAETKARLETLPGKIGESIHKVGLWYKKQNKYVKYGLAAGMFGAGLLTGGAGVAGGALAVGAATKRVLGAAAMGVGIGMAMETRSSNKQKERLGAEKTNFSELSLEQQNEMIKNMNLNTQKEYEKIKTTRRRIKFATISAVAGLLVGGQALAHGLGSDTADTPPSEHLSEMSAAEIAQETRYGEGVLRAMSHDFTDEMKGTKAFELFKERHGPDAYLKYLQDGGDDSKWQKIVENDIKLYVESAKNQLESGVGAGSENLYDSDDYINDEIKKDELEGILSDKRAQLAHKIARQMGIDNPNSIDFNTTFTQIKGQDVPESVLQQYEHEINQIRSAMAGDRNAIEHITEPDGVKIIQDPNTLYAAMDHSDASHVADNPTSYPGEVESAGGSVEIFNDGQKSLLELLKETSGVSADTTMEQLNMTNNAKLRDMMAGITMRASQEFGSNGLPHEGETIGAYLQRVGELHGPEGIVNSEILKAAADKSLGDYQIDTDIPDVVENEGTASAVETYTQDETLAAEEQSVASAKADNPTSQGTEKITYTQEETLAAEEQSIASAEVDNPIAQNFEGIDVSVNGNGLLTIEKGSSIEGTLIKFLMANNDKLTEGGMGWDADKYRDVQEWAGKRAHGLAVEFAKAHPGIDLDTVQPGTMLELNLNNLADVKVDIDFEGGAHIVPEQGKIIFDNAEDNIEYAKEDILTAEEQSVASHEADNPTPQETKVAVAQEADRLIKGGVNSADAKEFAEMEMAMHGNIDSIDNVEDDISKDGKRLMQQRDKLRELAQKMGVDNTETVTTVDGNTTTTTTTSEYKLQGNVLNGKEIPKEFTQEEITKLEQSAYWKDMVDKNHAQESSIDNEQVSDEVENHFENMTEGEAMRELVSNTEFKTAVAKQIQEMSGASSIQNALNNVAKTDMNFYLADGNIGIEKEQMEALRDRAVKAFGDSGNPRPGVRTGEYFTRIFAKSIYEGKVKDIFPSAEFTV